MEKNNSEIKMPFRKMSQERFLSLLRHLQFDHLDTKKKQEQQVNSAYTKFVHECFTKMHTHLVTVEQVWFQIVGK